MTVSPLLPGQASAALAALDHATQQVIATEVAQVVALVAVADYYRLDGDALVAGVDRLQRGGSEGTPLISEFVAHEVGALLGVSPTAASFRIADVLNLRHRHPRLWEAMLAGRVRCWQAVRVAREVADAGLGLAAALAVDEQLAAAMMLLPTSRALGRVESLILHADPELAAERARRAAAWTGVVVDPIEEGTCGLHGRLRAGDGIALDTALDQVAGALDRADLEPDQARAVALGLMARTILGQDALPLDAAGQPLGLPAVVTGPRRVELQITLTDALPEAAEVAGHGWLPTSLLDDVLAGCQVIVKPVLVESQITPVDAYAVPDRMRELVCARNPIDVFPYATTPARSCDLDHTIPYDHDAPPGTGQTRPDNLGPLGRRSHRAKTHAGWQLRQPSPGCFVWASPAGYTYAVTPNGTTRIGTPPGPPAS